MQKSVTIEQIQHRIASQEDPNAYKELYDIFFHGLYRFSLSIVRSHTIAEEMVSDVFIKVWQIRKRLTEITNLKVYLFTLVKSFSINFIHRQYGEMALGVDELHIEPQIEIGNRRELCISPETVKKMQEAINQLSPQGRLIFQLIKEEGFKCREVAMILNISPFIVRNQLAIAVRRIAEILPSYRQTAIPNIKSFSAS